MSQDWFAAHAPQTTTPAGDWFAAHAPSAPTPTRPRADKVIDIPGVGVVAFPDSMTEDAITAASAKLYADRQTRAAQAQPPDPIADVLRAVPGASDEVRADAWDAFHDSADVEDFARRLTPLALPQAVKAALWDAKAGVRRPQTVDYAALADQVRRDAAGAASPTAPGPVDYAALADQVRQGARAPDFRSTAIVPSTAETAWAYSGIPQLLDVGTGALKGLGNTVFGLGQLAHDYTPIGRISDAIQPGAFAQRPPELEPTNTAQRIGYGAEQIGEFFLPTGEAGAIARYANPATVKRILQGADVVKAAGTTWAQTGSPTAAGVSGALSAVLPAAGAAKRAIVGRLEEGAEQGVMRALGPTKERYKAIAARLTPDILKRGLRGSRESLQAKAADTLADVGQQLDTALQQYGSQSLGTTPIRAALETAKDAFRTTNPAGKVVEFEPRAIRQLSGLQQVITDLGPNATVDQLIAVRRAWDKVVDQAGGFAHRAGGAIGVPLKDQSEAWAKREATNAIRRVLDQGVPDVAALNKEYAFWKNLDDVLTQTLQRTQPQGPGLLRQGAEAAGQVVGGLAGSSHGPAGAVGGAFAVGKLAKLADQVFRSPRWQLASAQAKDAVAQAIASGRPGAVAFALTRITSGAPSLATQVAAAGAR